MATSTAESADLVTSLQSELGSGAVLTERDAEPYLRDWRGAFHGPALCVARPASTEEVATVASRCAGAGVAVVSQGGNTGLCGGSVPLSGGTPPSVLLSLSRMRRIEAVDADRFAITAQAGCTVEAVQDAARQADRLFAPDWGVRGTATIGGGISTNAGGMNVLRFGTMRDQVLGIEVVLPDGRVWDGRRSLRKDNTGYDLKQLFIGAEGTLGVVTSAVLRLHPSRPETSCGFVALPTIDALMPLFSMMQSRSADLLTAFELVPGRGIHLVRRDVPTVRHPLETERDWYVLLRLSGPEPVEPLLVRLLAEASEAGLIDDAVVASTPEQERNLWTIRDELPVSIQHDELANRLKFDIAVPLDRMGPFQVALSRVVAELVPGTSVYAFGHVGDGNLHVYLYPGDGADRGGFEAELSTLAAAVDQLTWSYDGSISAEHGVGQEMRPRLLGQKSTIELELMAAVKTALDPNGVMNPGKVLP